MSSDSYTASAIDLPVLPESWTWRSLRDLVDPARGICYGIVQPGKHDPLGVPMVNTGDVFDGYVAPQVLFSVSRELHDQFRRSTLRGGELLITLVGANFGRVAIAPDHYAGFNCSRAVGVVPVMQDSEYVMFALRTPLVRHLMDTWANTTAQPTFNLKDLGNLPVPIPPASTKNAITQLLQALDNRIALLRETNATLEAIAQALFKSWFVDFEPVHARARGEQPEGLSPEVAALFPDGFEESEVGLVPKGWNTGTLGDVAHFQNGYAFKSKDWCESGHPVVKIGDVKPGIIDFSGCSYIAPATTEGLSRFKLRRGDLLVGMTGYVGETGLVSHVEPHAYLNQRVGRIATKSGLTDLGFVYCLVRNSAFKGYAEARSHGSAQANVSGAVLLDYSVVIPTQNILDHFNGAVGVLLERILSNHEQAQTLATLRDTLLPRLISGQLRLPEAEAMVREAQE